VVKEMTAAQVKHRQVQPLQVPAAAAARVQSAQHRPAGQVALVALARLQALPDHQ